MEKTVLTTGEIKYTANNRMVIVRHCVANCKLTYLNSINSFLGLVLLSEEKKVEAKKAFDEVLKECRIAVYLNTQDKGIKEFILNNYEVYSCSEIPIGYSSSYQYHIILRNSLSNTNNANIRPTEYNRNVSKKIVTEKLEDLIEKGTLKKNLVKELSKKL